MNRVKTTLLLCLLLAIPTLAHASVVWEDASVPSEIYTGSESSYYTVGADVLGTLSPGEYNFSLDYQTLGTWDSTSPYADFLIAIAMVSNNLYRTVESTMVGEGLYNISLDFLIGEGVSPFSFIGVFSDVTAPDEEWRIVGAKITSATPIPGAAWLLASGLFALVGLKRRARIN